MLQEFLSSNKFISVDIYYCLPAKYSTLRNINPTWAGMGPSRPATSNILMKLFIGLSNWSKILWLFLKLAGENFVKNFFSAILVNYSWRHHYLAKVILVKLKILYILMQWSKWFIFWNICLYCKIVISFLELFSAICFLYILQMQLVFWNFFLFRIYFSLCMLIMMYNYSFLYEFPLSSSWG